MTGTTASPSGTAREPSAQKSFWVAARTCRHIATRYAPAASSRTRHHHTRAGGDQDHHARTHLHIDNNEGSLHLTSRSLLRRGHMRHREARRVRCAVPTVVAVHARHRDHPAADSRQPSWQTRRKRWTRHRLVGIHSRAGVAWLGLDTGAAWCVRRQSLRQRCVLRVSHKRSPTNRRVRQRSQSRPTAGDREVGPRGSGCGPGPAAGAVVTCTTQSTGQRRDGQAGRVAVLGHSERLTPVIRQQRGLMLRVFLLPQRQHSRAPRWLGP